MISRATAATMALLALAACQPEVPETKQRAKATAAEPETVDIPQTVTAIAPGTTPMRDRVAVLGFLNKRNGISRDLTLKPGQAVRIGDAVVRLRACETTAPYEVQQLTGAFVQLDVTDPQNRVRRAFSGWLYKETPSLNVVEHPVYDVWPKSCAMTHPGGVPPPDRSAAPAKNRSSAPNSTRPPPAASPEPAGDSAVESNAI